MAPQVLVVYTSTLFAEGLVHLLGGRGDCSISGMVPASMLTPERLVQTPATVIILEGDEADPATAVAARLVEHRAAAFVLIRVNLSAPMLHIQRFDQPMPAGLDELTAIIRGLTDQPGGLSPILQPPAAQPSGGVT